MSLAVAERSVVADDDRLSRDVERAICGRLGRKGQRLRVRVDGGSVTVHGVLESFYEKQLSLHAAMHVQGVSELIDELEVAYPDN